MKKTFLLLTIYCLLSTTAVFAQEPPKATEYELLAPIPQLTTEPNKPDAKTSTAKTYIEGLFTLIIGIAGVLAVVKIIFGGIQYMSTDAFTGKEEAKTTIQNAIWGLLLAISAWLILFTINPNLVNLDLKIPVQDIRGPLAPVGVGVPVTYADCPNCEVVGVPHKRAPYGCAAPGPCAVNGNLNGKLVQLRELGERLIVTESFPPTITHQASCHSDGTCVDATIPSNTPQNIKKFIDNANKVGLRAVFEVSTQAERTALINGGAPASSVIVVQRTPPITPHFSVYLN